MAATHDAPRPRLLYGSAFAWMSVCGGRFMAPFLEHEAGFSDSIIGITLALQFVCAGLFGSFGGAWADAYERKYPRKGRAYILCIGATTGSVSTLLHGARYLFPTINIFTFPVWHVMLRCIFACATCLVLPVLDGLTLAHLESLEGCDSTAYGRERLHGAIWWGIASLALGPFLDWLGFVAIYPAAAFTCIATLITALIYVRGIQQHANLMLNQKRQCSEEEPQESTYQDETCDHQPSSNTDISIWKLILRFIGSLYTIAFFVSVFCQSTGMAVIDNLVFLFFEFLGGSNTMCGLTVLLTVAFEVPIFQMAPALLKRFGPGTLMQIANIAFVVRVIGYTLVPQGRMWYILGLELLHGVTYGCFQTSAVEIVDSLMPMGYEASGQGILFMWMQAARAFGTVLGGVVEDDLGPRTMYRILALIVTFGMIVFGMASCSCHHVVDRRELIPLASGTLSKEGTSSNGSI